MRLSGEQIGAIKQGSRRCPGAQAGARSTAARAERQAGFTLTELVVIIVIVGIISAVAMPRFFDATVFQSRSAADQVKAALRYAQKVAIAQRASVSVVISSAADSDCGTVLAGGNVNCVIADSVSVPAKTVTFDALGRPVPNAADSIVVGTAPNDTTISIEAETGYVH